jgi:Rieske Fe-S protein
MGAGNPDWAKLQEMGKLPNWAKNKVPYLAQKEEADKRMEEIKNGVCDECREKFFPEKKEDALVTFRESCQHEGCEYTAEGRSEAIAKNNLRLHSKTHEVKE